MKKTRAGKAKVCKKKKIGIQRQWKEQKKSRDRNFA